MAASLIRLGVQAYWVEHGDYLSTNRLLGMLARFEPTSFHVRLSHHVGLEKVLRKLKISTWGYPLVLSKGFCTNL